MNWIFIAKSDGPFKHDPEEIDETRFFSFEELKKLIAEEPELFAPGCIDIGEKYLHEEK